MIVLSFAWASCMLYLLNLNALENWLMAVDSIRPLKPFFMEVPIKDGHHIYRCFERHLMLYYALLKDILTMVAANPYIEKEVRYATIDGITIAENYKRETKTALVISQAKKFWTSLTSWNIKNNLTMNWKIKQSFWTIMTLFVTIIMFTCASRQ